MERAVKRRPTPVAPVAMAFAALALGACVVRADVGESEPCLPSQSECLVAGRPRCVDPSSDRAHCGACDVVCDVGDACVQGRCAATQCAIGERRCEGELVLECARDRTRFVRASCARGTHCEGAGLCVDNVAQWPTRWTVVESEDPPAQTAAPWQSWGGACGARGLGTIEGETAYTSSSDRTFHGRSTRWPTTGAWAIQARLRWQRDAQVRVMLGAYTAFGRGLDGWTEQLFANRDEVSLLSRGAPPRVVGTRAPTEQWHTVRFEADTASARGRWLLNGVVLSEIALQPIESFGPYLLIAGYGPCMTNVMNVGRVTIEEGGR
jgi:hypothetical protein